METENETLKRKLNNFEDAKKKEFESLKKENEAIAYENIRAKRKISELEAECERLRQRLVQEQQSKSEKAEESVQPETSLQPSIRPEINESPFLPSKSLH